MNLLPEDLTTDIAMKKTHYGYLALSLALVLSGCGGGGGGSDPAPDPDPVVSDLILIQTQVDNFADQFVAGSPSEADILAQLAPGFVVDGLDASAYASQLTSASSPVASGDSFDISLATVFDDASQNNDGSDVQWFDVTQFNAAGDIIGSTRSKFVKVGDNWLAAGNERDVQITLRAESAMTSTTPATFSSDINIAVDPTSAARNAVASVIVSGADVIPTSGVTVYSNPNPATPGSALLSRILSLCDAVIETNCTTAVDGSQYTLTLKDTADSVIATYQNVLNKAPIAAATLNASQFPTFGTISPVDTAGISTGTSVSLDWSNPLGLNSNWVDYTVWDSNGELVFQLSGLPAGNSFTATMPTITLETNVAIQRFDVTIQGADALGRQYVLFM